MSLDVGSTECGNLIQQTNTTHRHDVTSCVILINRSSNEQYWSIQKQGTSDRCDKEI